MPRPRKSPLRSIPVLDLAAELTRRRSELPALMARHAEVASEMESVASSIVALGSAVDAVRAPASRGGPGRPAKASTPNASRKRTVRPMRTKNDANLPEVLTKVLTGKTMSVADAADAVKKAGYKTNSKHFRTMVNIALLNKKKFKRVERGTYTVIETKSA